MREDDPISGQARVLYLTGFALDPHPDKGTIVLELRVPQPSHESTATSYHFALVRADAIRLADALRQSVQQL